MSPQQGLHNLRRGSKMKIYVGNLSYEVTEEDLRQEFEAFGEVTSANIITDKYSGRPKGLPLLKWPQSPRLRPPSPVSTGKHSKSGL
jgi:hypothetical protein